MHTFSLLTPQWSAGSSPAGFDVSLPLHRRLSVNQLTTLRWSLPEAVSGYRRGGIPAMGVSFDRMKQLGLERAIEVLRQSGLMVSSLNWIGGFTGTDDWNWYDSVQEARLAIWTAGQLKAQAVHVLTGPRGMHIRSHAKRIVIEALYELAPFAEACRVRLALQPLHSAYARRWTFLHSLDETLSMLNQVDHPWVGLALSPFHLANEAKLLDRLPEIHHKIASVQLSDRRGVPLGEYDRYLPGEGGLPLREFVFHLEESGYRGLYEIDSWCQKLWQRNHDGLVAECRRRFEALCSRTAPAVCEPFSLPGGCSPSSPRMD